MDFPKKITKRPEDLIRKLCRYEITQAEQQSRIKLEIPPIQSPESYHQISQSRILFWWMMMMMMMMSSVEQRKASSQVSERDLI